MKSCEHSHIARRTSLVAMAMALSLVALKIAAWSVSGSVSVFASMLDSLMDALMSLGNALAAGYAAKPADDDHLGHQVAQLGRKVQTRGPHASHLFRRIAPPPRLRC